MPDQFLRPSPPFSPPDAHYSLMASLANDARLVAGQGISIKKGLNGTTISVRNPGDASDLHHRGLYNFTSSYNINDVVFVDPLGSTIFDQNNNPIPFGSVSGSSVIPICAGLFVCAAFVPAIGFDDNLLSSSVAPVLMAQSQSVTSQVADQFRHYSLNVYYPIYPLLALYSGSVLVSSSAEVVTYVTESTWHVGANRTFWWPLAPMFTSSVCNQNGNVATTYVAGVVSGSFFQYQLPYPL